MLAATSLGLLRLSISLMLEGDPAASIPLIVFILLGPGTVLLYFLGKLWSRHVRVGYFLASGRRVFLLFAAAVGLFMLPTSLVENSSWGDWGIDVIAALALAAFVALVANIAIRRLIPDSPDDTPGGH